MFVFIYLFILRITIKAPFIYFILQIGIVFSRWTRVTCSESDKTTSLLCVKDTFLCVSNRHIVFFFCSVHAYIVFKTEQSAQASLSHNMSLVCPWFSKLMWIGSNMLFYLVFLFIGIINFFKNYCVFIWL